MWRTKDTAVWGYLVAWFFALSLAYGLGTTGLELFWGGPGWVNPKVGFGMAALIAAVLLLYAMVRMTQSAAAAGQTRINESYALTNKRALWASPDKIGHTVKSIPIMPNDWIGARLGSNGRIIFSRSVIILDDEGEPNQDENFVEFRDIPDAEVAYKLIRQIQGGTP